jgi:hypothetical protein
MLPRSLQRALNAPAGHGQRPLFPDDDTEAASDRSDTQLYGLARPLAPKAEEVDAAVAAKKGPGIPKTWVACLVFP